MLLALGAEQGVQWLNWQSEVKETRKTLANEISYNLASRKLRNDQVECVDRRLDVLQRWHDSWVAGKPLKPTSPIGSVASRTVRFDAWNIAQNGQVAAHIPLEDRIRYARLYDFFRSFQASIATEAYLLTPYEASASVVRWDMTAATASRAVFPWSFPVAMTDRVAA